MPTGVYKRKPLTEKHRRNISESMKKNHPDTVFKKGQIPWNKNLTKETDERVRNISEKAIGKKKPYMIGNQFRKGYPAPPKAFKKGNQIGEETRFKKGNIPKAPIKKGEHRSPKTEFKKGQIPHNKEKQLVELYEEEKVKIIKEKMRRARNWKS